MRNYINPRIWPELTLGCTPATLQPICFVCTGSTSNAISLDVLADDLTLDIDTAIPTGLIINELVTNSLKYAFPAGRKGKIGVEIQRHDGHGFVLYVRDDGVGLPGGFDLRKAESLGLQLVAILIDQLNATTEIDTTGGTTFKITVPL